ncbi:MAG: hypothetical protein LBR39_07320 [Coriobacteriales bacterium]|nr:hypothetical protein [Coriobacteriales bacterium]
MSKADKANLAGKVDKAGKSSVTGKPSKACMTSKADKAGNASKPSKPSKATPARLLALRVTGELRQRSAYAAYLLESEVRPAELPQPERDFAELLVLGVAATFGELDLLIDGALGKGHLQHRVRDALRLSTWELVFLGKEPWVAVSQGVELVRSVAPQAAGLANKVLHEIANIMELDPAHGGFPFGDPATDDTALAHQQAFPLWLAQRLIADLGREAAVAFMQASNQPAPNYLWQSPDGTALGIDESAQAVARLATPAVGQPYLEVGAGRGGKTVLLQHLAAAGAGRPTLHVALDLSAGKRKVLEQRIEQFRLQNVRIVCGDVLQLDTLITEQDLPVRYAGALIDAPCSGTGTLRRHPEIRWRLTPEAVTTLADQGLAMLQAVAPHIAPGGFIVYSTCSALREENEQVVERFLAAQAVADRQFVDAQLADIKPAGTQPAGSQLPGRRLADMQLVGQYLRTQLTPGSADAHFAARLERR